VAQKREEYPGSESSAAAGEFCFRVKAAFISVRSSAWKAFNSWGNE
jgi:hypothetical protein